MTTPLRWWTDEDVQAGVLALWDVSECRPTLAHKITDAVLAALSPRVAALVADAERAGAVKALRDFAEVFVLDNPGMATNLYRRADVAALVADAERAGADRLRLSVDYTPEGAETVIRQLQELRREREARAALAKAWDEGLQRGEDIAARDSAFYTDEWVKNPYRPDE